MSARDTAWLAKRLAWHDTAIEQYEAGIVALSGGAQSYRINTGQTETTFTRAQLSQMRNLLSSLMATRSNLYAQLNGGSTYVRPGW